MIAAIGPSSPIRPEYALRSRATSRRYRRGSRRSPAVLPSGLSLAQDADGAVERPQHVPPVVPAAVVDEDNLAGDRLAQEAPEAVGQVVRTVVRGDDDGDGPIDGRAVPGPAGPDRPPRHVAVV